MLMSVVLLPTLAAAEDDLSGDEPWAAAHEEGLSLYQNGEFDRAVVAFERANEQGAPAPNLYNLARSYQQSGRLRRAIEVFDRYLAAPNIPEERLERARVHRDETMGQLARVEVQTVPPGASVVVEGQENVGGQSPIVITLDPGSYRVEASLPEHELAGTSVSLIAGAHQVVTLTLEPRQPTVTEPEPEPAPPTAPIAAERWRGGPWVVFGIGAGVVVTSVALWAVAYSGSQQDERFETVEDYNDWQYWVYDLALAGDILLAIGATAAVAGLIWLTIDKVRARRSRSTSHRHNLSGGFAPIRGGGLVTLGFDL